LSTDTYRDRIRKHAFCVATRLQEFCSLPWLVASYRRVRDERGGIEFRRLPGVYPVRGMVTCGACGKFAPPAPDLDLCVDCGVQKDVEAFRASLDPLIIADRAHYFGISWRRPVRVDDWINGRMQWPSGHHDAIVSDGDADSDELINEVDLFDGALEKDQTWGNPTPARDVLKHIRGRFVETCTTKSGLRTRMKRHGAGCSKVLLGESEDVLIKEIAFFERTGAIIPSARRINHPFDRRERCLPMPGQDHDL
jgi:hypothetical protein